MNEMRDLPLFLWPPGHAGARRVPKTLFSLLGRRWLSAVGVSKLGAAWLGVNQIKQSVTPAIDRLIKSNRSIVQSANCTYTTKIKRSITVSYTATDRSHSPDQSRDRSQLVTEIKRQQSANPDRNKQIRSLAVKCSDRL